MIRPLKALLTTVLLGTLVYATNAPAQAPGISSELERASSSTPQEKIDYGASANYEMQAAVKTVTKLLEAAKQTGNLELIQCLANRLTSMRALLRVSQGAHDSMGESIEHAEPEKAAHEFRKVAVALTKTRKLLAEAQLCGDEGGPGTSSSSTTVTGGEISEGDAVCIGPLCGSDGGGQPPLVSPFF